MVRTATMAQALTSPRKKTTAATVKKVLSLSSAGADVPVTTIPTGKVNDHQVREKTAGRARSCSRRAR